MSRWFRYFYIEIMGENLRQIKAQNVLHLASYAQNCVGFWGSAPDPDGGAYDAPHAYPLVVRGFLPSAIAASRLRRSQFHLPNSDILVGPPNFWTVVAPLLKA